MNISPSTLSAWNGEAREDRPEAVDDALRPEKRRGYDTGLPLVEPPGGVPEGVSIADDLQSLYSHYPRNGDDLLKPQAGEVLRELAYTDGVTSAEDIAEELGIRQTRQVRKALELHRVEVPSGGGEASNAESDSGFTLPSGESIPSDLYEDAATNPLILAALASAGLSVSEAAAYIQRETGDPLAARDVREACSEHGFL